MEKITAAIGAIAIVIEVILIASLSKLSSILDREEEKKQWRHEK